MSGGNVVVIVAAVMLRRDDGKDAATSLPRHAASSMEFDPNKSYTRDILVTDRLPARLTHAGVAGLTTGCTTRAR